jgi:peptidoglycan/xylan/chitin deacetylase (PgdA/CDA1 family)
MSVFISIVIALLVVCLIALSCRYYFPFRVPVRSCYPRALLYHACDKTGFPGMPRRLITHPDILERQFVWLKKKGYLFLTASELVCPGHVKGKTKSVCITFDDGFEDNYIHLFPLLKKYQIKITLFASQQSIFPGKAVLSESQIREMSDSGLVEFGGHTQTHLDLSAAEEAVAEAEIRANKQWLEALTGKPCAAFAYPFGKYTERDILILKRLGFTSAFTCERAIRPVSDPLQIPRLYVNGKIKLFQFPLLLSRGQFRLTPLS